MCFLDGFSAEVPEQNLSPPPTSIDYITPMTRILRYIFGILFLTLGVVGLFLPILQGILFLIVGLIILAPESRLIQGWLHRLEARHPRIFQKAHDLKERFRKQFKRE